MQRKLSYIIFLILFFSTGILHAAGEFTIARIKYSGGGDWYSDPTSIPNLLRQVEKVLKIPVGKEERVSIMEPHLFSYPFIYITGHGKIVFSEAEVLRLRSYFEAGGFLWADDNYGMDEYFRREIRKVFPECELIELPFDHPIYHMVYDFDNGLPKIHEHHGGPPHGYGIIYNARLVVFYTFNTDIGDGLEDAEVHNDPPEKRDAAMRMAINIVAYALTH